MTGLGAVSLAASGAGIATAATTMTMMEIGTFTQNAHRQVR
jgi:hypothetical protein